MATLPKGIKSVKGKIVSVKGECSAGHRAGDILEISCWDTGGLCGFFYHDIFPTLNVMQFGGRYPWGPADEMVLECPDRKNLVTLKIWKE
ncbi:MAG: TIGR04076 family protein [Deltaproteobacteria bacterium]|nr:TIGR04076 family protein [Deltaproteobacteria bacterium]